jgi:hypothetical protein
VGSYEHGDKLVGFVECGEFLDQLRKYKFIEKYSAPCRWLSTVSKKYTPFNTSDPWSCTVYVTSKIPGNYIIINLNILIIKVEWH